MCKKCAGVTCECGECDPETGKCNPPDEECKCHGVTCKCGRCDEETGECTPRDEECKCTKGVEPYCCSDKTVCQCDEETGDVSTIETCEDYCANGECQEDKCKGVTCECGECDPATGECNPPDEECKCHGVTCKCGKCDEDDGNCYPDDEDCRPCEEEGAKRCRPGWSIVTETCVNGYWQQKTCHDGQICKDGTCIDCNESELEKQSCGEMKCPKGTKCKCTCGAAGSSCKCDITCEEGSLKCLNDENVGKCTKDTWYLEKTCADNQTCSNGKCVCDDDGTDCPESTPDWDAEACKCVCKKKPCESGQVWDESACTCVDPCAECKKSCRYPKACVYNLTQQTCECKEFCGETILGPCQKCGTDAAGKPIPVNLCNECQTCKNGTCVNNNNYDECMCDGAGTWTGTTCCSTAKDGKDTNGVYTEACCKAANGSWSNATCCSTAKDGKDIQGTFTEACCKAANGTWEDNKCSFNCTQFYTAACCRADKGTPYKNNTFCCLPPYVVSGDCCTYRDGPLAGWWCGPGKPIQER